jgi:hypothetical protein
MGSERRPVLGSLRAMLANARAWLPLEDGPCPAWMYCACKERHSEDVQNEG